MPIPDDRTRMLPVLRLAAEGGRRVGEVAEVVADPFGLGEAERAEILPSGWQRVLHNPIHPDTSKRHGRFRGRGRDGRAGGGAAEGVGP